MLLQWELLIILQIKQHFIKILFLSSVPFPYLVLLISGGHCLLAVARQPNDFLLLGKSLHDAPGEAFDKVDFIFF